MKTMKSIHPVFGEMDETEYSQLMAKVKQLVPKVLREKLSIEYANNPNIAFSKFTNTIKSIVNPVSLKVVMAVIEELFA